MGAKGVFDLRADCFKHKPFGLPLTSLGGPLIRTRGQWMQSSGICAVRSCAPCLGIEISWKTGLNRSVIIRIGSLIGLRIGALVLPRISPFPISREALGKGQRGNKKHKNQKKSQFFHDVLLPNIFSPIRKIRSGYFI